MARNCSSKPQWSHLEYRWTLENFWELRALASIDGRTDNKKDSWLYCGFGFQHIVLYCARCCASCRYFVLLPRAVVLFFFLLLSSPSSALEDDSVVWSPRFGDVKKGLWRLKVYPYGDSSAAGKGHVSVFLALDTTAAATTKTYAIFACYVLDAQGNKGMSWSAANSARP